MRCEGVEFLRLKSKGLALWYKDLGLWYKGLALWCRCDRMLAPRELASPSAHDELRDVAPHL